jgi:hypothetical protein
MAGNVLVVKHARGKKHNLMDCEDAVDYGIKQY